MNVDKIQNGNVYVMQLQPVVESCVIISWGTNKILTKVSESKHQTMSVSFSMNKELRIKQNDCLSELNQL